MLYIKRNVHAKKTGTITRETCVCSDDKRENDQIASLQDFFLVLLRKHLGFLAAIEVALASNTNALLGIQPFFPLLDTWSHVFLREYFFIPESLTIQRVLAGSFFTLRECVVGREYIMSIAELAAGTR